ncbi:MAG: endonuclease [Bacilli bacterium]
MKKTASLLVLFTLTFFFTYNLNIKEVSAALRDETRTITTTNWTDTQVHGYYDDFVTEGMAGNTLKTALNDRIKNHTVITPYAETKYAMAIVDRDYTKSPLANGTSYNFTNTSTDNPYLRLMYGKYNGSTNAYQWNADHTTIWNKEHTWAKSLGNFGETAPAGTDLHHLIAADQNNNNYHSNLDFGEVISGATNVLDERGNISGKTGYSSLSGSKKVYEPADEYKGDIARMVFYMATRYLTYSSTGNPQLRLVDNVVGGTTVTSSATVYGELGILSHYLQWNEEDPVDAYEIKRNNLIYHNFQGNRNPYIDHPEWAEIVFDTSYTGAGATIVSGTSSVGNNPAWAAASGVTLSSISVNATSMLTTYALNEAFDSTGLVVTATMSDNSTKVVTGWTTDYDGVTSFGSSGNKTVTVTYVEGGVSQSTTFNITVDNKTLNSLSLDTTNVTTTFAFQGTFNQDNLIVNAVYSDASTRTIPSSNYTSSSPDLTDLGSQNITISYAGLSQTYAIQVTLQGANLVVANDLFFSEYMEGSSNNKYVEIYNGTGDSINLEDYQVKLFANGATTPTNTLDLTGTLPHDEVIIIYNSSINASILSIINAHGYKVSSSVANFNGDDGVGLYLNGVLIDQIGIVGGTDPGSAWTGTGTNGSAYSTLDRTLVRSSSVYQGNTSYLWTGSTSEWTAYAIDTSTYLGDHTFTSGNVETPSLAYGQYFLDVTGPYCAVLDGANIPWNNLATEYDYLTNAMKDYFTSTNQATILSARLRYEFLVNKYPTLDANNFLVNGSNTPLYAFRFEQTPESNASNFTYLLIFSSVLGLFFIQLVDKKRKQH